jgi:hypothetical protein
MTLSVPKTDSALASNDLNFGEDGQREQPRQRRLGAAQPRLANGKNGPFVQPIGREPMTADGRIADL